MLMLHFLQIALRISIHIYATILVTYDYKQGALHTINVNIILPTETDGIWLQFMWPSNLVHVSSGIILISRYFEIYFFNIYVIIKKQTSQYTDSQKKQTDY
jgi:hypothetical protein